MKKVLIAIFTVLAVLPVTGQKEWSLEDCIRFAVENNLDLKQSAYSADIADQLYRQEKWNMVPQIGASSQVYYYAGRYVDPKTNGIETTPNYFNDYNLQAGVNVFNGFSRQNKISYLKFKKEAAASSLLQSTDELAFTVMNSYYDVLYFKELLRITQDQKHLSEVNLKKTEILVNTGLKATTDLLEVKANLEKDELNCLQSENLLSSAWISLHKAMNLSPDSSVNLSHHVIPVSDTLPAIIDQVTLYQSFSSQSPEIKSFEQNWKASKKNINVMRAGFAPSLDAGASLSSYVTLKSEPDFSRQLRENEKQYAGLTLSIPLFGRRQNITNVKVAKLEYAAATAKLDQARQNLYFEMMTNINDLKAAETELSQARKQLAADTLAYQAAEKKYEQGMINVVDFYTVKNRMSSTCAQVLRSELTAEIKRRIIEFYRGNRFWEK
jgi:outer membrane protein